MVVLRGLPNQQIIDGFKKHIDFYVWMGLPCARKWPVSPGHNRTQPVEAQWPIFSTAAKLWIDLAVDVKLAYNTMAVGTPLTGRDIFVRSYISGIFQPPT